MTLQLLLLGLVIGSNNLAAALALGALGQAVRRWRIAIVVGGFEFCVPLAGLWLGRHASGLITAGAGWLGPALLIGLGVWSLAAELRSRQQDQALAAKATTWPGLVLLAGSLSLDNLLVGFSLGLGNRPPLLVASLIASCSVCFTLLGLWLGNSARRHWERPAGLAAGILLIGLGLAAWLGWI